MARGPVRATRPHTPSTRGGRGGLRGSHMRPSCETGRHAAVKKTGKLRSLKNQIRGVQRLLKKPDLDSRARTKQAAVLDALQTALDQNQRTELERKYAVRYHKVRFFERVKLERQIKRLEKQSVDCTVASDTTAAELVRLRDDLQYVLHFPQGEKYVSIVKRAATAEAQALLDSERSRLRGLIAQQLTEAAMLAEPDEGNALRAAWAHAHMEGTANSSNASDDFFLQDGDPEEAAATHASQHAPTNKQVPAQAAGKAPIPTRGGLAQQQRNPRHGKVKDGKPRIQSSKGHQRHRNVFLQLSEDVTAAQPGREGGLGPSRRALTDRGMDEQPAAPDIAGRATVSSAAEGEQSRAGGRNEDKHIGRPRRKQATTTTSWVRSQLASPPRQIAGNAAARATAAETEHAQTTQLRTREQGGRKRRKKPSAGQHTVRV